MARKDGILTAVNDWLKTAPKDNKRDVGQRVNEMILEKALTLELRHFEDSEFYDKLTRARRVARALGAADHRVVRVDLSAFGGSALTDEAIAVPKDRPASAMGSGIPVTYVPARNTVLLALALAHAETIGAEDVFLGVNAIDYSGYPDCRPEYIEAYERLTGNKFE